MSKNSKRKARRSRQATVNKVKPGPEKSEKLVLWQHRLAESDAYWQPEVLKMDEREEIYTGGRKLNPMVKGDKDKDTAPHVRNIVFENIESMVSTAIPNPKVTAVHPEDEEQAEIIENHIRNLLDKLPTETNNDTAERTVPIQGGVLFHEEWDDTKRTHNTVGEYCDSVIHPKQLAPQPGVYTDIEDMDWFILKTPTTKEVVMRKFGIDVETESESEPQIRSTEESSHADDALTLYIGYERNDRGGIDKFCWVNDIELLDLEDYQARRQPVCKHCQRVRPLRGQVISGVRTSESLPAGEVEDVDEKYRREMAGQALAGQLAGELLQAPIQDEMLMGSVGLTEGEEPVEVYEDGPCPWCGGEEWEDEVYEYERVILPIHRNFGEDIPGEYLDKNELGQPAMVPTLIPFYKPDLYPVILQKSVSVFGQLLGNSDVDAIRDQQNTINRLNKKIVDRLMKAGTRITLPKDLRMDPEDGERWFLDNPADKSMIDVYDFAGNIQFELAYESKVYEESRQILGITDSFQGRKDPTATSGKAKEYAAAMAAGRQESKRVMKNAAYAKKFELMFKFFLAYADEPVPVVYKNFKGETLYKEFNRYDFLKKDANGDWYWNTDFLFSVDTAGPLAANREAMWQETRMNLQTGAFGDPAATETLILFWSKMEMLHYPGAASTKKYLEEKLEREQAQQMAQMQAMQPPAMPGGGGVPVAAPAAQAPMMG